MKEECQADLDKVGARLVLRFTELMIPQRFYGQDLATSQHFKLIGIYSAHVVLES